MAIKLLLIFFSVTLLFSSSSGADADVIAALAISLTNTPPSWKPNSDPCTSKWQGINCDSSGAVTEINLGSKSLGGSLPPNLNKLSSLKSLQLQQNQIAGSIPSLSTSLQIVALDGNLFNSIPNGFFSGLASLQKISLDDNPLDPWSIPDDLSQCNSLTDFSASNASINGTIPDFLGTMPSLQTLRLSYNQLTGGLPLSFGSSGLQNLILNNQGSGAKLSGRIDVIGSATQLSMIWLQSNSFTGPIPDVSNLTNLLSFNVRDNDLTGVVPESLLTCPTLTNVTLSNNKLQGPFPQFSSSAKLDVDKGNNFCSKTPGPCDPKVMILLSIAGGFGYPIDLATSWNGNDPCAGWAGVACDASKNIQVLNFANKHFTGIISPDVANLTTLTKLILNNNSLTGKIPEALASMPLLQLLDVSNNNLSGSKPNFKSSVTVKLSGNPSLGDGSGSGGSPDQSSGDNNGSPGVSPSSGDQSGKKSSSSAGLIAGVVIAAVVVAGCFAGCFYYNRHKRTARKFGRVQTQSPPHEPEMVKIGIMGMQSNGAASSELYSHSSTDSAGTYLVENHSMSMSIQALRIATNNFSEDYILGRGGFGVVYKGDLNGTLVAVKRNESLGSKGMAEFHAEIDVLRKVRHRHLVGLLGYCIDGNERLLVYEYMPEGTLGQHLFEWNEGRYAPLSWKQRLTIALDVARGIEYLHSLAQESFIHRDLKPSNILLDKDMRAKVSDFGLVKLADNTKSLATRLAGTFGYLAPEYATTGKVTTKVDVYAYGVILMELITGRRALDETRPEDETHLVTCFRRNIINKEKFMKTVDSFLDLDDESREGLLEVAELARHCTAREPYQRPDMGHAVNVLAPLIEQWKPTSYDEGDLCDSGTNLAQRMQKWQLGDGSSTTDLFGSYRGSIENSRVASMMRN
ncbi:receptor-like kinase TMK4 [Dioscorea cayenensis subsp. rotundata]|uniref:non-specific serine/threonine protein kinase n=1 Tax=Dioscorea cayennensis subsp. rotundata TaxID=55577 RepID=A0AB40BCI2_DIOCR|nr:receptor-like kinase TMK4 [Dioscorea cayenensis subsp. rotundata]